MNMDKAKISVVLAIVGIGGGAFWLAGLSFQSSANAKAITDLSITQVQYQKDFYELKAEIQVMHQELRQRNSEE